jgi:hypothetical protein
MVHYNGGFGSDYRFKLIPYPTPSTLLTNLEYPKGMWLRGNDLFLVEANGRSTSYGGKNGIDRYNITLGQMTTLVNGPENPGAVVAGIGSDSNVYLSCWQDTIPGEVGAISWVDLATNIETHLLDLEIATEDMCIDEAGDIYIIGSSNLSSAKSIYRLPYGGYANPQVLQTGLGSTWCIAKNGDYVYFSTHASIKRFDVNTPGTIETFMNQSVMSMSFMGEYLYFADYFGGIVGRIHLDTRAVQQLAVGLHGPHAVRCDPSSYKVYFNEAGTDSGQFKDGTLKVIDLN